MPAATDPIISAATVLTSAVASAQAVMSWSMPMRAKPLGRLALVARRILAIIVVEAGVVRYTPAWIAMRCSSAACVNAA